MLPPSLSDEVPEISIATPEEEEPVIENIKAEKLEGPKILGKIELPVDSDTRPKPQDEKRKRRHLDKGEPQFMLSAGAAQQN